MLLALALVLPAAALDADTFDPVGGWTDARGGPQVLSPDIGWPGAWNAGLALVYANNPVVRRFEDGTSEALVSSSFGAQLLGGYVVGEVLRIDAALPVYPFVGGPDLDASGFSVGDARIDAVIPLVRRDSSPVAVSVAPRLLLPTGNPDTYTGAGGVGGALTATAGVAPWEAGFVDANVGVSAVRATTLGDFSFGSALSLGLGVGHRIGERWAFGAELDGQITLADGIGPFNKNPFELHGWGQGTFGDVLASLGVGTGVVAGVGAPDLRVLAAVSWRSPGKEPVRDTDGDTVFDDVDGCVTDPEDRDGFDDHDGCPDPDNDKDRVDDIADKCPTNAEDRDLFQDEDGCPDPDNDGDGLRDPEDACPDQAGTAATGGCPDRDKDGLSDITDACPDEPGPAALKGCPDRDADLVPDARDACPDQPRDPREDPARSDGCPKRVIVSLSKIEILETIRFDTAKTSIKAESFPLLEEIAKTLRDNADISRVEVAGHTDSDGNDAKNLKLSQGRAEAVVAWLTTTGRVDAARVYAVGYGETKPVDTNATAEGRTKNRRVEFTIKQVDGRDI